tara:strand:- start:768 stop:995 length:228 start_codon:yes stop_codon:yes gene_type:complete
MHLGALSRACVWGGYETATITGNKFLNRSFAACPSGGSKTYNKKTRKSIFRADLNSDVNLDFLANCLIRDWREKM